MSKREWTPPNDEDTVRLLRTMPLPEHLGGGLCKHAAGRIDALRSEVLQYGNIMGRIAIALFGDQNNRTDEECVAAIAELGYGLTGACLRAERAEAERDALRAELTNVLADWNALVAASGSATNGGAVGHVSALRADAERYRWARDILGGDDSAAGDRKAAQLAHGLMLQLSTDAAIDAARTEGEG